MHAMSLPGTPFCDSISETFAMPANLSAFKRGIWGESPDAAPTWPARQPRGPGVQRARGLPRPPALARDAEG